MRRLAAAVALSAGILLTACTPSDGPTDQEPRTGYTPAAGWHSVSYHGISVDVPDDVQLTRRSNCSSSLPLEGALVVPFFDGGSSNCPSTSGKETVTPRPTTRLTVLLGPAGFEPAGLLVGGRHEDVLDVGARVTASGPADLVDGVLGSIRVTPQDAHGCADRIDPNVAPRNTESPNGSILPVATSRIAVCEYGRTETVRTDAPDTAAKFWLVASAELGDDDATDLDALIRASPTVGAGDTAPGDTEPGEFGPVLRLLVLGEDGNTRTLQALSNLTPQPVTDGRVTVDLDGHVPGGADTRVTGDARGTRPRAVQLGPARPSDAPLHLRVQACT